MAGRDAQFQRAVEASMRRRQAVAVQVDGYIRLNDALGQPAIPATIKTVTGRHRFLVAQGDGLGRLSAKIFCCDRSGYIHRLLGNGKSFDAP